MDDAALVSRKKRKQVGRELKRRRIEESGGVRPRAHPSTEDSKNEKTSISHPRQQQDHNQDVQDNEPQHRYQEKQQQQQQQQQKHVSLAKHHRPLQHRFGRVMDSVPTRNKPRHSTLSIAVPGSIVANCQTKELRTQLAGQIARYATIYHVDEIVVFDDKLSKEYRPYHRGGSNRPLQSHTNHGDTKTEADNTTQLPESGSSPYKRTDPHEFMARILQYCECPQYLRKQFFPMHPDLQYTGLLAPIDAPHHVREYDRCKYREGVVLEKMGPNQNSLVNCGIRGRPVEIDVKLSPGIRCTVQLDPSVYTKSGQISGKVVSPSAPRLDNGTYWGYTTRLASSLKDALEECPFTVEGYDLKIGTSERGRHSLESKKFKIAQKYKHCLIVFGGVAGIEESVDADETIKISGSECGKLFDQWINVCPFQGSRTIRTEEAVLITLAKLSPLLNEASVNDSTAAAKLPEVPVINFSDNDPSEESSDESSAS